MADNRRVWEDKLPLPRRRVLRLIRDDLADLRSVPETPDTLLSDIRLGDFRSVLADIPDGSIDLILTDPPYPAECEPWVGFLDPLDLALDVAHDLFAGQTSGGYRLVAKAADQVAGIRLRQTFLHPRSANLGTSDPR